MRYTYVILAIIAALLLAACGGSKKTEIPIETEDLSDSSTTVGETPASAITEEEDLTEPDKNIEFDTESGVSETSISDMTLEEINAAEFLKNIYFEFDKYDLTDSSIQELQQNADWLTENPSVKIIIEGHCDERGTEEYNLALGERRANAARDFLIRMNISKDRIMTASYGESRPQDTGQNERAWALNRRAHFRVYAR